ncbi:cellulase family glycosylhydrolase [Mycetocola sp. 2940]|uniref:glycoside hydrolase family 5 protein n=1 Tax=Mycetocola sp. 2940 TaxID=3156452 RepID=UPI003392F79E
MSHLPTFRPRPASFDGFVHASDARLVDGSGREILLRGVGLGNWMLPEGYMWKFSTGAESPREIEALSTRLLGEEGARRFWQSFYDGFVTEADIRRIAESGFDHVRLPINARLIQAPDGTPLESGYAMIDRLIAWCRTHKLWVLLDLHGAPGGQTGTNIDDSPRNMPELFMDENYRALTLRLWRDLAGRYAAETVVLGYDLLNEPLPNEWQDIYATELVELYQELTRVIREVDDRHLIVYEGSHWATNWSIFTEVWDENSLLQFHKYWSSPDTASIAVFLDTRDRLGLPIYMGEGGENTLEWIYTAFRLYESHNIGWNFWPWKKIDTLTSPASIPPPTGWEQVVAAASNPELEVPDAERIFGEFLRNAAIGNCVWRPGLVAALLGERPPIIPAWGFGTRGAGESYSSIGSSVIPGIRSADEVALSWANPGAGNPENPFQQTDGRPYSHDEELVVTLQAGDWLEFEAVDIDPASVRVVGAEEATRVESSARGIRVVATGEAALSRLVMGGTSR